jgi:hypothetical protein
MTKGGGRGFAKVPRHKMTKNWGGGSKISQKSVTYYLNDIA